MVRWLFNTERLCVVLAFLAHYFAVGEVIEFKDHLIEADYPEFLVIPKFSKNDAPNWSPGHGKSYIDLSRLKFTLDCAYIAANATTCPTSTLELLVFEEPTEKDWMDYWPDRNFCCTDEMVTAGYCSSTDKLYIPNDMSELFVTQFIITSDEPYYISSENIISHQNIQSTGLYIFFMANCDVKTSDVRINGQIESMDPYGYLPADLYQNLPFYGALSLMYTIIGVVWLILCMFYSHQLIPLQLWITLVLALGMIETTILFSHYLHWNDYGSSAPSLAFAGLIIGIIKRTFSRIVVTLVALGYGIVRPTLGEDMNRVMYLGGSYFFLSFLYTITTNLPVSTTDANDPEYNLLSLVILLLAGIDTTFYVWIFSSINSLLTTLAARKQALKYLLYRNFRGVLFVSLFFTIVWGLYSSILMYSDGSGKDSTWQFHWSIDALWELTYFFVFVTIAVMWAPSKNAHRYAQYSQLEMQELEFDEDWKNAGIEIIGESEMTDGDNDRKVSREYGGKLNDDDDPFHATGALDSTNAILKKQ